jgi:hypothetical protein
MRIDREVVEQRTTCRGPIIDSVPASTGLNSMTFRPFNQRLFQQNRYKAELPRCPTSLIGRLGSSAFRLSTTTTSRSLAGYALLFGIGTKALPSWDPRTRWNNLRCDLASRWRQDQSDMRTHLIHRPARDTIPLRSGVRVTSCDLSWLWLSCCCSCLSRPSELGAIHPDAVHDHR